MMPAKKSATKKAKRNENIGIMLVAIGDDDEPVFPLAARRNGRARKEPYRINPETAEEHEQRLAKRKALTLKAARIAYDNHHRGKAS